jgi:competence protein ComEA
MILGAMSIGVNMKKFNSYLILIALICMLTVTICACEKTSEDIIVASEDDQEEMESEESDSEIFVYVCGEVKNPGVYQMNQEDRIVDAIEAAGGLTKKAAADNINQAQKMEDGQQIYVPSKEDGKESSAGAQDTSSEKRISINQATKEELMTLPGIGEAKAESIIAYRQEHGNFQKIEDLMNISGIKEGVYNKIKEYIML